MLRRTWFLIAGICLLLGSSVSAALAMQAAVANQWAAVLPGAQAALEAQVDAPLSRYVVDVEFTPATETELGTISGDLELGWVNPADEPADVVHFRLYVNDSRYREGAMTVTDIEIDGEAVIPDLSLEQTLMTLPLAQPVPPGATADISLSFEAVIPNDTVSGYGMFNHDTRTDSYTLDHWLPLLAGYDPAHGFDLAPLSVNGDPVFSNVAWFEVTIGDLSNLVLASTGVVESEEATSNGLSQTLVSGPVRNFTMAISANYEIATGMAGDTEVRSYFLPGHEERGIASVNWAIDSIELFNDLIGPYPYAQFSIVDAEIGGGAAGIEFPQIVYMASNYYDEPVNGETVPRGQEYTLVHEVLHQWFYGVVGNNQHQHAFLDESITNYLTVVYFERMYGEEVALQQALLNLVAPYVIFLHGMSGGPRDDEIVNTPTDAFSSSTAYGVIIYNKGPLAFQAFREAMGDDSFFAAVASYYREHLLHIGQPDDLRDAFVAEAPPGLDFPELWQYWIEEANGREDFPAEVLDAILTVLRGI
jgi:hypothetical protein